MAFFRTVTLSEQLPAIVGESVLLRAPQMSDFAEWAALREASRDFLTPWEPTWPPDDLTRGSFRRRIKRYSEDQRSDLAYPFFVFRKADNVLVGGLTPPISGAAVPRPAISVIGPVPSMRARAT